MQRDQILKDTLELIKIKNDKLIRLCEEISSLEKLHREWIWKDTTELDDIIKKYHQYDEL